MGERIADTVKERIGRTFFPLIERKLWTRFAIDNPSIPVLMFHQVVPSRDYKGRLWTILEKERFSEICQFVSVHFSSVFCRDLEKVLEGKVRTSKPPILLTFDDGWFDNLAHALPVLKSHQLKATIFVTTGGVGNCSGLWPEQLYQWVIEAPEKSRSILMDKLAQMGIWPKISADPERFYLSIVGSLKTIPDEDRRTFLMLIEEEISAAGKHDSCFERLFRMLDWPDLKTLIDSEFVEIGLHTHTHPILSRCTYERVVWEIEKNMQQLNVFDIQHSNIFAYPNGGMQDFGEREINLLKTRYCVDLAFSTVPGYVSKQSNRHCLPRLGIGRGQSVDSLKYALVRQLVS